MQMDVLVSDEVCATMNTLMPWLASVVKMRRLTPMTPTMERPDTVTMLVSLIDDMPRMGCADGGTSCRIVLPLASGWKVFLIRMGMFLTQTG